MRPKREVLGEKVRRVPVSWDEETLKWAERTAKSEGKSFASWLRELVRNEKRRRLAK
jgi:hypothetical protein